MSQFYRIKTDHVKVRNDQFKCTDRFEQNTSPFRDFNFVWCESWKIIIPQLRFQQFDSSSYHDISNDVKLNLNWNRMMWIPDYRAAYEKEMCEVK